jgi:hypothetical protein
MTARHLPLLLAAFAPLHAAEPAGQWFDHAVERAWVENYDPTLITRRVLTELSFEDRGSDDEVWKIENSLRWGIPLHEGLALGLQAMVPVKWQESGDDDLSGLGDLEVRTGLVGRISPTLRWGFGLNAAFDTAAEPGLGADAFVLRPIAAIRWDFNERIQLGFNLEYNVTPADEGANDVSQLELKFPLVLKLTDRWSGALTYKPRWDLLAESDRHRLELGATRTLGADLRYALSLAVELPLASESFDSKLTAGLAWHF